MISRLRVEPDDASPVDLHLTLPGKADRDPPDEIKGIGQERAERVWIDHSGQGRDGLISVGAQRLFTLPGYALLDS